MSIGRRKYGELPVHYDSHPLTCYGLFLLWDATISTLYLCGQRMALPEVETG